jgi:hypothetical protein
MGFGPTSSPTIAATRRPSTSYVLASLRALHIDLLLASGKVSNDRERAICAQACTRWGQNSPNMNLLQEGWGHRSSAGGASSDLQSHYVDGAGRTDGFLAKPRR